MITIDKESEGIAIGPQAVRIIGRFIGGKVGKRSNVTIRGDAQQLPQRSAGTRKLGAHCWIRPETDSNVKRAIGTERDVLWADRKAAVRSGKRGKPCHNALDDRTHDAHDCT